jgi:hypothetical protein
LKRKNQTRIRIAAKDAAKALHLLIAEGKIAAKDITNALQRRQAMIADLRKRLAELEAGVVSAGRAIERTAKRRLTAKRRAALKLHGQYLGYVRTLSSAAKAKAKAIRKKSGVRAAIAAARRMAK